MSIRSKKSLLYRSDLDTVVSISPDEAGIFDIALFEGAPEDGPSERTWENALDELSIILSTGVSANADILEAEYEAHGDNLYSAHVIGQPADSTTISRWTVTFTVKS
jgi:hypothetical protein